MRLAKYSLGFVVFLKYDFAMNMGPYWELSIGICYQIGVYLLIFGK